MTKLLHLLIFVICWSFVVAKPSPNGLIPFIGNNENNNNNNTDSENVPINQLVPLIINNSGSKNNGNDIANGNDDMKGNLINGNNNGNNSDSGNVRGIILPLIINNSGSNNENNSLQNGNDNADGNLVNGDGNGDNANSGNIKEKSENTEQYIINTTTEVSPSNIIDKLLRNIDVLLESVLKQVGDIKININILKIIDTLLSQVKAILENALNALSDNINESQNSIRVDILKNLIKKVDRAEYLLHEKIRPPSIIISLSDVLNGLKVHLELTIVPVLLQQVLQLLETTF